VVPLNKDMRICQPQVEERSFNTSSAPTGVTGSSPPKKWSEKWPRRSKSGSAKRPTFTTWTSGRIKIPCREGPLRRERDESRYSPEL